MSETDNTQELQFTDLQIGDGKTVVKGALITTQCKRSTNHLIDSSSLAVSQNMDPCSIS